MASYIVSIDQGTTSSRAILFDQAGSIVATSQQEFPQHFPNDGWVEHEPKAIWHSVKQTCQDLLTRQKLQPEHIAAIGITNQRETTILWHKETGEPIYNAIVWQDRRTAALCQQLKDAGHEADISAKTGLLLDPYFSASKIKWILDNVDGARTLAEQGLLAFGTVDTYLLWQLTAGKSHKTDATNASRTMLYNIHQQAWDADLLALFDIPASILPEVCDSADHFGVTEASLLGAEVPILGVAGDQQASLIGQTCFHPGMAKSTYGTGCFFMLNTGKKALRSKNRLLTTIAYRLNGEVTYALEGSIFMAGATIQWLRDGLQLIQSASETESIIDGLPVDHGVYLVPAFTGLGAPYWDPEARGAIMGLTRDSGIKELVSAALQSVVYQTKDLQKAMEDDGVRATQLHVDGGMVQNNWLMQFLADMLGAEVDRPTITETTALGAAYLAGLKLGWYASTEDLEHKWQLQRRFTAGFDKHKRDALYQQWQEAVGRIQNKPRD